MPRFVCFCGAVTREEEEPPGASRVMYSKETLRAIEAGIADRLAESDGASTREVIEDIVSSKLNRDCIGVFRCPACHRVAIKAADSDRWNFYVAEAR